MAGLRFSPARPRPRFRSIRNLRRSRARALSCGGRQCPRPRPESAQAARSARAVWRSSRPPNAKHGKPEDPAWYRIAGSRLAGKPKNCSRFCGSACRIFWAAGPKQMLDSRRAPAQAVDTAPSGGSASAAAPMRPTSCGDGHGTTGADRRQDRRGTRSGIGVAAFSRTARSGAASGAASVRQGPVSAPPDGGSGCERANGLRFPGLIPDPLPIPVGRSVFARFGCGRHLGHLFRITPSR